MRKITLGLVVMLCLVIMPLASAAWTDSLNTNIRSYFKLNDTSGTVAENSVNTSANGTATNNWVTNGKIAGAFNTASTSQYIFTKDNLTNVYSLDHTIAFWFNNTGGTGNNWMAGTSKSGNNGITVTQEGGYMVYLTNATSYSRVVIGATSNNNWIHIAIVLTATGTGATDVTSAKLFYNGVNTKNLSIINMLNHDAFWKIGCAHPAGGSYCATGRTDEYGFWYRALSNAEISQLYNSGNGITYTPSGSTPTNTCTPPTTNQDWTVNWVDNCTLSTSTNLGTGSLIMNGTLPGTFTIAAGSNLTVNRSVMLPINGVKFVILPGGRLFHKTN